MSFVGPLFPVSEPRVDSNGCVRCAMIRASRQVVSCVAHADDAPGESAVPAAKGVDELRATLNAVLDRLVVVEKKNEVLEYNILRLMNGAGRGQP